MTIESSNPLLQINGEIVKYEPDSFKYQPGRPDRKGFPDTGLNIHVTEDITTALAMVSFDLRTRAENREKFTKWIDIGKDVPFTFSAGGLNSNMPNAYVENANIEIPYGSDAVFTVVFKGKNIVE